MNFSKCAFFYFYCKNKTFHGLLLLFIFTLSIFRSSHQRCSMKKGVLRNFAKFTEKHLCQSLFFNKVTALRPATLLQKRPWHRYFPVSFGKFLRTPFYRTPLENCFCTFILWFSYVLYDESEKCRFMINDSACFKKLTLAISYLFLFFDECISIIINSFHLFLNFSLYVYMLL